MTSIHEINKTVLPELEAQAKNRTNRIIEEITQHLPEDEVPHLTEGMRDFAKGVLSLTDPKEGEREATFTFSLDGSPGAALSQLTWLTMEQVQAAPHHDLLRNSLLVSSISGFEVLFGRVARSIFKVNKAALNDSDHAFTLQQLADFASLDDAREFLLEQRVSKLLYESLDGWEKWLKRAGGGASMVALPVDWPKLREAFARRNLLVHADGVANHLYLEIVSKLTPRTPVQLGEKLRVNGQYLDEHLQEILALGRLLSVDVGMKLHKREKEAYLSTLTTDINRLSHKGLWRTCIALSKYALGCELTRSQEINVRTRGWIAQKEEIGLDSIKGEVEGWDVSGLAPIFALRKDAILELDSTIDKVRPLLEDGTITVFDVATDPLYKSFRKQLKSEIVAAGQLEQADSEEAFTEK
ncbi:hypothetical protein OHB41_22425 [Streptomyces sp. NBC_01571]|uniref:hypothetical protein n=1 Tax=Streptomyces sp. NBC_01571 TaxID=2975883 RepID=UPI002250637E|nr:hypothetical protein [Streptomyces sp. NBC_01571]MCX4575896.1 hypothetical protein [Streptomyces sp. NBC_01571]